jgi:hypothetical protein
MAITYRGTAISGLLTALHDTVAMSIECTARSLCRVDVIGLMAQSDTIVASTTAGRVSPMFKARKITGTTSGGIELTSLGNFDTAQTHDPGVIVRQSPGYWGGDTVSPISYTGTPATLFGGFGTRVTTIIGQQVFPDTCLGKRGKTGGHIYLAPGEALLIEWNETSAAAAVGGMAFFQIMFEEDSLGTEYVIGGNVTLNSVAVSGAKVLVVTDLDRDLPSPSLEVLTTGAPGTWTKTLASAVKASVFVQARSGETLYTDEGKPYITKP